jgi:hypothetical protein
MCGILLSAQTGLQAQPVQPYSEETEFPDYAFSVEPLYLYNGGLRLTVEKRLTLKNWLELHLTGYYLPHDKIESGEYVRGRYFTSNSDFNRFTGLGGVGIGGAYKHYFLRSFFINTGVSYTYYRVQYRDLDFYKYREDELDFYAYQYQDFCQTFNKFTAGFSIGARSAFQHILFVEYYFGLGYAHSLYNRKKAAYDSTPFGFGYTGVYPAAGIKIGFNIR